MTMTSKPDLHRDHFGHLHIRQGNGQSVAVTAVRNFPISAPNEGISLVNAEGSELAWIDQLSAQDDSTRALIEEDLTQREFTPEIQRVIGISSKATPSIWDVETNRGLTRLTLKGEEDIRRLSLRTLLITDNCGVQFLLRDLSALDRHSRRLLDHFL